MATNAQRQPSSPPASAAIPPAKSGAMARPAIWRRRSSEHLAPGADRVGVHEQRPVHRERVRLAQPGGEPSHEQLDARWRPKPVSVDDHRPRRHRRRRPTNLRGTRSAIVLIGTEPRKNRMPNAPPIAPMRGPGDAQRAPDVGREHGQTRSMSNTSMKLRSPIVTAVADAVLAQRLSQRHRRRPDAGQHVVGQDGAAQLATWARPAGALPRRARWRPARQGPRILPRFAHWLPSSLVLRRSTGHSPGTPAVAPGR